MNSIQNPPEKTIERESDTLILETYHSISINPDVKRLIDALPYIAAILNKSRQLVYTNEGSFSILNGKAVYEILGKRPGEIIECVHANKGYDKCGTSEFCDYCGVYNAILRCQQTESKVVDECRITTKINGEIRSYDFQVTASPFFWNKQKFTIIVLVDISSEKRRKTLENIFFHDVLNVATSLNSFFNLLKVIEDPEKLRDLMQVAESLSNELMDEIRAQHLLMNAEKGDLIIVPKIVLAKDFLADTVRIIQNHQVASNRKITIDNKSVNTAINTDTVLLKRILINMLKNALEDTAFEGTIKTGCYEENNECVFWVQNHKIIPKDIRMQVFQRSFSTKGQGRGVGTYSMKLLGENYLKGKINFTSNQKSGTIFRFILPIE